MSDSNREHLLLSIVSELYNKIARLALAEQTKRHTAPDIHMAEQHISAILSNQIDYLVNWSIAGRPHVFTDHPHLNNHQHDETPNQGEFPTHPVSNDLSRYLIEHHADQNCHPRLAEQMKAHTNEHIHAALRYARQGDRKTAGLHAELTQTALKGLCCLLPAQDYASFAEQVEQFLTQLQSGLAAK